MKKVLRRNIAFPTEFLEQVKAEATKSCRTQTLYIKHCVEEFWKTEAKKESRCDDAK